MPPYRPLILYHANCPDGFCAAWVAHRRYGDAADYLAVNYGQPPPAVTDRHVRILDFSYKRPVMAELIRQARSVVVLDHHPTAAADLDGLADEFPDTALRVRPLILFDQSKSGARLTWECIFPGAPPPWLVAYTEDRDLWRWQLPESRAINTALSSYPFDFAVWDQLDSIDPATLVPEGTTIVRYKQQLVDRACAQAHEIELAGHRVLAVNATCMISEIAGQLAQGRPFGATYFIAKNGRQIWSLRSRNGGVDVAAIAAQYGGGGHRNAAGFELPAPPLAPPARAPAAGGN